MIGMTNERIEQLKNNPELRPEAVEEVWAEMNRLKKRLLDIQQSHYLIYDWEYNEQSGELTEEERQHRRNYLIAIGVGVTQPEEGGE